MSKQVPNNSWGPPVMAYFDIEYRCRDCGKEEVWTAEQQKCYYEEAKGSLYAKAVRCRVSRIKKANSGEQALEIVGLRILDGVLKCRSRRRETEVATLAAYRNVCVGSGLSSRG